MRLSRDISVMLVVMFLLSGLVACDAFNEHNEEGEILASLGMLDPTVNADGDASVDLCAGVAGVTVETGDAADAALTSAVNDAAATTTVKSTATGTEISVSTDDAEFAMTLKSADDGYTLCAIGYTEGGTSKTVTGGTITVAKFNAEEGDATVNAGAYDVTVTDDSGASKALSGLLGGKDAEAGTAVSGTYYAETVSE